jgi:hypothetical protein
LGQLLFGPVGCPHKAGRGRKSIAAGVGEVKSNIHDVGVLQSFLPDLLNGGHVDLLILGINVGSEEQEHDKAER